MRRLIDEVINRGRLEALDDLYTAGMARAARKCIEPFRASFPDLHMEIVELVAEGETVVVTLQVLGDAPGRVAGATSDGPSLRGRRRGLLLPRARGQIARAWGLEDKLSRSRQLGLPE